MNNVMNVSIIIMFLAGMLSTFSHGYQPRPSLKTSCSRRSVFSAFPAFVVTVAISSSSRVDALDIDSFIKKELDNETVKPQMSDDEALCKFGSPSPKTGSACVRAGLPTTRRTGVDSFGKVNRGDFVRCKPKYVDDPKNEGMLINVWNCQ